MRTARKVSDRIVMLYPLARLDPEEPQIIYDGPPSELDKAGDRRVRQFIHGEAGERLTELRESRTSTAPSL
jgi:phospholipid/cholesterol/gamma-HCH transport system ATP-binding protein